MRFLPNTFLVCLIIILFSCNKSADKAEPLPPEAPDISVFSIPGKAYGDKPFEISAPVSNSPGAITFTSSNLKVATVSGKLLTITGSGSTIITAKQEASGNFKADSVKTTLVVDPLAPSLTDFKIANKKVSDAPFTLDKPKSNSPGTFTYKSSNLAVATVNGAVVTIKGAGQCTITATQMVSGSFKADSIKATFTVAGLQTPTMIGFALTDKKISDPPFVLPTPQSNSTGAFSYTSSNKAVATINGNIVTIKGEGHTIITVTQAAAGNYSSYSFNLSMSVFSPPVFGTVTDVDGNVYKTVKIGKQVWMAENLKVTHYRDGTQIPNVTDSGNWRMLTTGAYCNYKNDINIAKIYGKLYNWFAVADAHQLAPKGWHIPTNAEWDALYDFIGGTPQDGQDIQETGTTHWEVNTGANNVTQFTGLPAGALNFTYQGPFYGLASDTFWWSANASNATNASYYELYVKGYMEQGNSSKVFGYSVRCIKD